MRPSLVPVLLLTIARGASAERVAARPIEVADQAVPPSISAPPVTPVSPEQTAGGPPKTVVVESVPGNAQPPPGPVELGAMAKPAAEAAEPKRKIVSISFSPFKAIAQSTLEIVGEFAISRRFSAEAILGHGFKQSDDGGTRFFPPSFNEFGLGVVGYPVGDFETGMRLGIQAIYVNVANSDASSTEISPFCGAKWTHPIGITLSGQLGLAVIYVRTTANSRGNENVIPFIDIRAGYSF